MQRQIILLLFIFLLSGAEAQNVEKAYRFLEEKKFDKAEKILKRAKKKRKELIAARFGIGLLYLNPDFKNHNNLRAYKGFNYAYHKFEDGRANEKVCSKYNITQKRTKKLMNQAAKSAFEEIEDKNEPEELTEFSEIYDNASYTQKIIRRRDSIMLYRTRLNGSLRAYEIFVKAYPESDFFETAQNEYHKLWRETYLEYLSYGNYELMRIFRYNHPDYPFYSDTTDMHTALLKEAEDLQSRKENKEKVSNDLARFIPKAAFNEVGFLALLWQIETQVNKENYKAAADTVNKYLPYFKHDNRVKKIRNLLLSEKEQLDISPISGSINTLFHEYAPCLTASGKTLYFCGRQRPDNLTNNNEDVFVSEKINGKWTNPENIASINTPENHEAPLAISADGNRMLMFTRADIYYTDKTASGWKPPLRFESVNETSSWEADAMLTADGNAILFISDRAENYGPHLRFGKPFHGRRSGSTDIYVSLREGDSWSKPINLGQSINTPFTERSPFLHPDMKTLYFSSDGHATLGRLDVFVSKRLSDTSWTEWSEPENIGIAVNSPADEYDYKLTADGVNAIFSQKDSTGNYDIFLAELPEKYRPQTVTRISGKILTGGSLPVQAEIRWEELETGKELGLLKSEAGTGNYIIVLPNGKNYGFFVKKKGKYPVSENVDLRKVDKNQDLQKNFILLSEEEIISGEIEIRLQNVFFDIGKHELKPESYPELNRLIDFIGRHPDIKIKISGHTDSRGSDEDNKNLSQRRAESVRKYLILKGAKAENLSAEGYGESKPVADNKSAEGRAKNRRVEFKVIKD